MNTFGRPYPVDRKLYYYGALPDNIAAMPGYGYSGGMKLPKMYPTHNYNKEYMLGYNLGGYLGGAKTNKGALAALLSGLDARISIN